MINLCFSLLTSLIFISESNRVNLKDGRHLLINVRSIELVDSLEENIFNLTFDHNIQNFFLIEESILVLNTEKQSHKIRILESSLEIIKSKNPNFVITNSEKWVSLYFGQKEFLLEETNKIVQVQYRYDSSKSFSLGYFVEKTTEDRKYLNNLTYDVINDLLIIQINNSERFFYASLREYDASLSSLSAHLGTNPSYAYWFSDINSESLICVVEFENKKRNKYEAFSLKKGIPKPTKTKDGSNRISQTWYELGYFIGYLDVLPETYFKSQFIKGTEVLELRKK